MIKRRAQAQWQGTTQEGKGSLTTPSGVFEQHPYSFLARFRNEDGTAGTNPEELIAAAHAGCFTMALSLKITQAGFVPEDIQTSAVLSMEHKDGLTITLVELSTKAKVSNMSAEDFQKAAQSAKIDCPVSKVLNCEIRLQAELV